MLRQQDPVSRIKLNRNVIVPASHMQTGYHAPDEEVYSHSMVLGGFELIS